MHKILIDKMSKNIAGNKYYISLSSVLSGIAIKLFKSILKFL